MANRKYASSKWTPASNEYQKHSGRKVVEELEVGTMAKVSRRLIPFVIVCCFVAFLDWVKFGFAALERNKDM